MEVKLPALAACMLELDVMRERLQAQLSGHTERDGGGADTRTRAAQDESFVGSLAVGDISIAPEVVAASAAVEATSEGTISPWTSPAVSPQVSPRSCLPAYPCCVTSFASGAEAMSRRVAPNERFDDILTELRTANVAPRNISGRIGRVLNLRPATLGPHQAC